MAILKDSGDRRAWETGAVRDMAEGKGRCDLLPLGEVAGFMDDDFMRSLWYFEKTGRKEHSWVVNALTELREAAFDGQEETMILELAIHFEDGARKYGDNNWRKGIPARCYLDSAIRHYLKWKRGDDDEPHARACAWNLFCMMWELNNHDQAIYEVKNGQKD